VIAVDTNVLVYAHRRDSPDHASAHRELNALAIGQRGWGIPWPCIHEFIAVVTSPRLYVEPADVRRAIHQVQEWARSPTCALLGETEHHLSRLEALLTQSGVRGGGVHDARIAAICLEHGVTELWSVDRDSRRFPGLRLFNPLSA